MNQKEKKAKHAERMRAFRRKQRERATIEEIIECRSREAQRISILREKQREQESLEEAVLRRAVLSQQVRASRERQQERETPEEATKRRAISAQQARASRKRQLERQTPEEATERRAFLAQQARALRKRRQERETLEETIERHVIWAQQFITEGPSTSTSEDVSLNKEDEISRHEIKVEYNDIFTEPLPVINIKHEDEEFHNYASQSEFVVPETDINSQQLTSIDKQTNNVLTLTNVNPIISHNGCSVYMVTAKNDLQTTNKVISSTINTEMQIKTEIPDEEDIALHNNATYFSEKPMVPVTQDESSAPAQTNKLISILKNNLVNTSNKDTLDRNNSGPDQTMIDCTMSTEDCATTTESENKHYAVGVLRKMLKTEKVAHQKKVHVLQETIRRLRKANEKLKETIKELKLENSLYS